MRNILVVVDVQKDFVDGSLGTKEAVAILDHVKAKIASYPIENVYVTMDTHPKDYLDTYEGKHLPVEHCIEGTDGWMLHESIRDSLRGARIFLKPGFGSVDLIEQLKKDNEQEPISVEMIGLCTDICVITNAMMLKGALPNIDIKVDQDCCAGVTPDLHEAALKVMRSCQIEVIGGDAD